MKDFSLHAYRIYIEQLNNKEYNFLFFSDYFTSGVNNKKICLLRHDVDRNPNNALKMAFLEKELGVKSTYFFRTKKHTFKEKIIRKIEDLGHEIGYHYESLSDSNGNFQIALIDFEKNLNKLRKIATIKTCAMHGRPFNKFDNKKLWITEKNHNYLTDKLNILGEVYLDIDYSDIAYINDTGRNWMSSSFNLRDKVISNINTDFKSGNDLLNYFKKNPHNKICFQIHPERWTDNFFYYNLRYFIDSSINFFKVFTTFFYK